MRGKSTLAICGTALLGLLVMVGCGSKKSTSTTSTAAQPANAPAAGTSPKTTLAVVRTAKTNNSKLESKPVLVDAKGMTLYDFEADSATRSSCDAACAKVWPPLLSSGKPKAGPGVSASQLGVITRQDGTKQVTYHGHPLYTYTMDRKAGDAAGNDIKSFGSSWYALSASGEQASS